MQPRLSAVLVAVLLVAAACAPTDLILPAGAARTTITFLIAGDPADEAAYRTLADSFVNANPDIEVELINIPGAGDFQRRLAADFAAGSPPDGFLINYRRYGPFVAGGAVEPIDPYLAQSTTIERSDFYPQALDAFTWRGQLMCLPQNMSSPVIYYNKDIFDAAELAYPANDWTWDEFLVTANALTMDQDADGAFDQYGFGIDPSLVRAAPFIWMNGGEIVDDPISPTRLTLDSPASRSALAWFIELQTVHHVTPDAVAEAAESSLSRFLNGRLAMLVESRRATPEFRRIERFDWDVAPMPDGKERASILHTDAFCIAAAGQHKDAAWRFVEFANTHTGQAILTQSGRTVPSRIELAEDPLFLNPEMQPANSHIFLDIIPDLRSFPALATWVNIEAVVDAELQSAFYGQISLDQAIRNAEVRSAEFFR
jgi:multiple sugar transport system substrate-binding protein